MPTWKRLSASEVLAPALHQWFRSELGSAVLAAEQRLIDRHLADCFGYHLLQLGIDNRLTLFRDSQVQRCFKAGPDACETDSGLVRCDLQALPFETDTIDVAIVHHTLEFAANPHAMLRELQRVLVPHGRLLMVAFNPLSMLGARLWLSGRFGNGRHRHQHWLAPARLQDWLELLNFACDRTEFAFHRLPFNRVANWGTEVAGHHDATADRRPWCDHWPLGGVYLISAVKEVASNIPIKPRWTRTRPRLVALPVVKPTSRDGRDNAPPSAARGRLTKSI